MLVTETNWYIKHRDCGGVWSGIDLLETLIRSKFCFFLQGIVATEDMDKDKFIVQCKVSIVVHKHDQS